MYVIIGVLLTFVCRQCWIEKKNPAERVHRPHCGKVINYCPEEYSISELDTLCRNGPINIISFTEATGQSRYYQNTFCKTCWENKTLPAVLLTAVQDNKGETNNNNSALFIFYIGIS